MQLHYSVELNRAPDNAASEVDSTSLFASILHPSRGADATVDEIEKYMSIGVFRLKGFLDVLSWWSAKQPSMPAHYQRVMDYLGTGTTLTPSERVHSPSGREFMCPWLSLSSSVLVRTMCVLSWMGAGIMNVPANRAAAVACAREDNKEDYMAALFGLVEAKQED